MTSHAPPSSLQDICDTIKAAWILMNKNKLLSSKTKTTMRWSLFLFNLIVLVLGKKNQEVRINMSSVTGPKAR